MQPTKKKKDSGWWCDEKRGAGCEKEAQGGPLVGGGGSRLQRGEEVVQTPRFSKSERTRGPRQDFDEKFREEKPWEKRN